MKLQRIIILQIILLLTAFSLIACSTDDNEKKEPAVETIIPGQWSGESGFGEIIFTVDSKVAGIESLEIIFMDYQCGQVTHSGSIKTTYSTLYEIIDRQIDLEVSLNPHGEENITINGNFEDSGDYISGDFEFSNGTAVCSGTWLAEPI